MKNKYWIFFGILLCLFLTGCSDPLEYDSDLFRPDQKSCWPCQMYAQTFQALTAALDGALGLISSNAMVILKIGLAFWLLFKVLPWVVSFSPPKVKEDFVQIVKVCFKVFIVSFFLTNIQNIYDILGGYVLQPIGSVFLYISEIVLLSPSSVGIQTDLYAQSGFLSDISSLLGWDDFMGGLSDQLEQFQGAYSTTTLPNNKVIKIEEDKMFGTLPLQIQSVIWMIYSALWMGMGLVFQLFQSNYFAGWIAGLFLGFSLLMLLVCLPLTFVDSFVRLGMGIILFPIFAVAWVFPIKLFEGMAKKLIELVFAAFFDVLFNCIYVAFLISVLKVYTTEKMPHLFSTDFQTSESAMRESGIQMSMDYLILIVLIMTVYKMAQKVDEITGQFFDGAGKGSSVYKTLDRLKNLALVTGAAVVRACMGDFTGFKNVLKQGGEMVKGGMKDMGAEQKRDNWV